MMAEKHVENETPARREEESVPEAIAAFGVERVRRLEHLFVQEETLTCALQHRCRPCCYKIALYGNSKTMLPNQRPEMCPRMNKVREKPVGRIGLYDSVHVQSILTVGDGNFSYSLALSRALPSCRLIATSHESRATVIETYPDGETILNELATLEYVEVFHGIDATNAGQLASFNTKFDRVIWNFPCVRAPRGEDGQNKEMEINKQLLHDFFTHIGALVTPERGEIHVTHKTKPPFGQWEIEKIAARNGLRHVRSVVFDRCAYPGYSNKKVLSKGSFPIWDSQTFVFAPYAPKDQEAKALGLQPVTIELLQRVYRMLTPTLDEAMGGTKKKQPHQNQTRKRKSSGTSRKAPPKKRKQ